MTLISATQRTLHLASDSGWDLTTASSGWLQPPVPTAPGFGDAAGAPGLTSHHLCPGHMEKQQRPSSVQGLTLAVLTQKSS